MDLSALESISKALEKSLDFWGLVLLLATALVVIGLVVEYWHDAKEFWIIVRWPMAAFPWDKFKTLVGGILVTIGVALELISTYKASRVETQLRENSHRIEAFLTQQVGDAAKSAQDAHDLGADLLEKYKAAEAEMTELKAEKLPRRLSSAQKATLLKRVAAFGIKTIALTCAVGSASESTETLDFELDFLSAFTANPVNPVVKVESYNQSCSLILALGVSIPPVQIEYGAQRQGDALILLKAIEEIGINKKDIVTKINVDKSLLVLTIGPKPNGEPVDAKRRLYLQLRRFAYRSP